MPILGIQNSLNPVYKKQLNEILNEDVNIYKQVLNREKEYVQRIQEQVMPKNYATILEIDASFSKLNDGFVKYLTQLSSILELLNVKPKFKIENIKEEVLSVGEPISYYNNFVRNVKNPALDKQSQMAFEVQMTTLLPYLNNILTLYKSIIDKLFERVEIPSTMFQAESVEIIPQLISAYSVFKLITNNINYRNYNIIGINDVNDIFQKTIIQDYPTLKEIDIIKKKLTSSISPMMQHKINLINEDRALEGLPPLTKEQENQLKTQLKSTEPVFNAVLLKNDADLLNRFENSKKKLFDEGYKSLAEYKQLYNDNINESLKNLGILLKQEATENLDVINKQTEDEIRATFDKKLEDIMVAEGEEMFKEFANNDDEFLELKAQYDKAIEDGDEEYIELLKERLMVKYEEIKQMVYYEAEKKAQEQIDLEIYDKQIENEEKVREQYDEKKRKTGINKKRQKDYNEVVEPELKKLERQFEQSKKYLVDDYIATRLDDEMKTTKVFENLNKIKKELVDNNAKFKEYSGIKSSDRTRDQKNFVRDYLKLEGDKQTAIDDFKALYNKKKKDYADQLTKDFNRLYTERRKELLKDIKGYGKQRYIKRKDNNPMQFHDNENDMSVNFTQY